MHKCQIYVHTVPVKRFQLQSTCLHDFIMLQSGSELTPLGFYHVYISHLHGLLLCPISRTAFVSMTSKCLYRCTITMVFLRKLAATTAATTAVAGTALLIERIPSAIDPSTPFGQVTSHITALVRFTRSLSAATHVMVDYRRLFMRHVDYTSDAYRQDRSRVHSRSAERMLALARTQGAVYVKIGQHIASMNHGVPLEYSTKLKLLEDRAAYRPFWQIRRVVERELKAPVYDIFEEFEDTPVAAASLAQVHRGRLKKGDVVAVKVQYPGLEGLVQSDLTCIKMLSWLLVWVFPFFKMDWVVEQFRRNLHKELDFKLEAKSAKRTGSFFAGDARVFVPYVHQALSTSKVLTMEYIDGCRVDDVVALKKAGINSHTVAQTVVDAFAQMIFVNGFVHCDPHPGNLMVRRKEDGAFELFLLDHGLYRELDDQFRQSYCKLWKGLVLRRSSDVEQACKELGAPGFANVFSVFLLNRSWNFAKKLGTDLRVKMSAEEMKQLRSDLRDGGISWEGDVSSFVEQIPDDLLLVFKMNSLVRNVNKALGASVNRFKVNARYAVRGLRHLNGVLETGGLSGGKRNGKLVACRYSESVHRGICHLLQSVCHWVMGIMDTLTVEMNLIVLDAAWFLVRWFRGQSAYGGKEGVVDSDDMKLIG